MGNTADGLPLRITFSFLLPFFFIHFFYCGKMNLAISLGLILSAVVVTARIVKPGGETNNYVDKAAAIPEEGDEEIVQTAVVEKKKSKPKWWTRTKRTELNLKRSTMQKLTKLFCVRSVRVAVVLSWIAFLTARLTTPDF